MFQRRVLVGFVLLGLLTACQNSPDRFAGETMGTAYSVIITGRIDQQRLLSLQAKIEQILDEINAAMSTYIPDSELNRFNRSRSDDWYAVSPSLFEVVKTAQAISELSNGAFDVTVAPLVNLWGFGPISPPAQLPPDTAINEALRNVGYQHLTLRENPPALKKSLPDLSVDLSAIAKGYAVDQIAAILKAERIPNFLVEIGGELYGVGVNEKGQTWRVGIEKPDTDVERTVIGVVQLQSQAIASSGDYKNYIEFDGQRYSHEIDARTGYPVTHTTVAVSVIADNTMLADAWATALLVMGSHQGLALAKALGITAYFVDLRETEFETLWTDDFNALMVNTQ